MAIAYSAVLAFLTLTVTALAADAPAPSPVVLESSPTPSPESSSSPPVVEPTPTPTSPPEPAVAPAPVYPSPPPPPVEYQHYAEFYTAYEELTDQNITLKALNDTKLGVALAYLYNVTFLSPLDSAWNNLTTQPRGAQLKALLEGENSTLVLFNLLLFHTITQYKTVEDLKATTVGSGLPTLLNQALFTQSLDGLPYVYTNGSNPTDNATMPYLDVYTNEQFVGHSIDAVLIPLNPNSLLTPRPGLVPFEPPVYPPPPVSLITTSPSPAPTGSGVEKIVPSFLGALAVIVIGLFFA